MDTSVFVCSKLSGIIGRGILSYVSVLSTLDSTTACRIVKISVHSPDLNAFFMLKIL